MKEIILTQGKIALVDDEDFEELNKYKWCAVKVNGTWYAGRKEEKDINGKRKTILMHQQVTGFKYKMIDHIDHDGLNNQKCNLRECSHKQNSRHSRMSKRNTSGYRGVSWMEQNKRWIAQIRVDNKLIYLGCFDNKNDAGKAYDEKAKEIFGDFAVINFKE